MSNLEWYRVTAGITRDIGQTTVFVDVLAASDFHAIDEFQTSIMPDTAIFYSMAEYVGTLAEYREAFGEDGERTPPQIEQIEEFDISDEEYWGGGSDPSLNPEFFNL